MSKYQLPMFERFVFNDVIQNVADEVRAHVVCAKCEHLDNQDDEGVALPEYWWEWLLDHSADNLVEWMIKHLLVCVEPVK